MYSRGFGVCFVGYCCIFEECMMIVWVRVLLLLFRVCGVCVYV